MTRLFGTNRREWDSIGIVWPTVCPGCKEDVWFSGFKEVYYFYIFFLPITEGKHNYYLICPNCKYTIRLSREEYLYAKDLNDSAVTYERGRINAEDYEKTLNKFDQETEVVLPKPLQPVSATKAEQENDFQPKGIQ